MLHHPVVAHLSQLVIDLASFPEQGETRDTGQDDTQPSDETPEEVGQTPRR